jgi:hypothetical protein
MKLGTGEKASRLSEQDGQSKMEPICVADGSGRCPFLLLPHLLLSSRSTSGQLIKTNGLFEPNLFVVPLSRAATELELVSRNQSGRSASAPDPNGGKTNKAIGNRYAKEAGFRIHHHHRFHGEAIKQIG